MKILIAEDDEGVRVSLKAVLSPYARKLLMFDSLSELNEALCKNVDVDLVLLDLNLSDSLGEDTAKAVPDIRRMAPHTAVVLMSGRSCAEELKTFMDRYGADAWLHKPEDFGKDKVIRLLLDIFTSSGRTGRSDTFDQHLRLMEAYAAGKSSAP